MLDFLNSLGKKMISQPERVSTDTYSDAITGQVKDTVVDYVENFPIADSEFYSKLGTGVVGSLASIPAETVNLASYTPYSPFKVIRESGALKDFQKPSVVSFLKNQALKVSTVLGNPDNPAFTTTGNVGERYAEGLASDVLLGFSPAISKLAVKGATKIPSKLQDLAERTENPILDMMDALAIAGTTRKTPLSQFGAMVNPTGIVRSEMAATPKRTLDENYFYNKAEDIAKNLTQEKGTSKQFLSMFEKAGVTKDEFKWSGLGKYLEEQNQAKQPITKEGVIDFLGENRMSVNIKELANEVDYDNPQELDFRTEDLDSSDDFVRELMSHEIDNLHYQLGLDEEYAVRDVIEQLTGKRQKEIFSKSELRDVFVAYMKESPFQEEQALDYALKLLPSIEPDYPNRWIDYQEAIDEMSSEKASELTSRWEDFKNNTGTVYEFVEQLPSMQTPKFSELYDSFGGYGPNVLEREAETFLSLSEEYPNFFARQGFDSLEKLRAWRSDIDDVMEEIVEANVLEASPHEISAYDANNNVLYSAVGYDGDSPYHVTYGNSLELNDLYDPNEVREAMANHAFEHGDIEYNTAELYEHLVASDVFGTREVYNVNLYEDTSDLALKNMSEADVELMEAGGRSSLGLQSHFSEFADTNFPIGHARSTIKDLDGQGVEFEDDYLKISSDDKKERVIKARETLTEGGSDLDAREIIEPDLFYKVGGRFDGGEDDWLSPKAIKTRNLDGKVYAIHELQSDVAQKLTSSRSDDYTASGLEKKKDEVRKIIGKNPESKMMEFDDRAEAIREKGNEFVKNLNQWQQSTPSKLTQEEFLEENKVREFRKSVGNLETETHPQVADHLFRLLVERRFNKDYRNISDYLDFKNKNEYQTSADTPYSLLREKEEIAVELRNLEKDTEVYKDAQRRLDELERIKPNTMDAPYIQEKRDTTKVMLKGEIAKAVDADADYVTLGEPIFNRDRQGFGDAEEFYGVAVPRIAEKLLKPLDPDIKLVNMDVGTGEVVKGFKITEKLKKSLKEQGQSFFAPFAAIGAGILGNKVANEEERSYE